MNRPALTVAACAAASMLFGAPSSASAIPWDQQGLIPPSKTPAPERPDPLCDQSYANDAPSGGPRLEFGIGPRLAGEAGAGQVTPTAPENVAKRNAALRALRGEDQMRVRLNRLFMADGAAGISEFKAMAREYIRLGYEVELQVRYHPAAEQDGDIRAWLAYVKRVVRAFGPMRHVVGLQITNEVNLTFSPNTSDGAYANAVKALALGVPAAKAEAMRRGFGQLEVGFNYAWRFGDADAAFWREIGEIGGERLRRATDWVGVDAYPGTFVPAAVANPGDALLEALAQVRECYMPKAGFGRSVPMHLEEIGYPTGPGRSEADQRRALTQFVTAAARYRGTYNLTNFNWFGLRDNNSAGPNFQSFFGLLRDDYSPKPAFGDYRRLISRFGA